MLSAPLIVKGIANALLLMTAITIIPQRPNKDMINFELQERAAHTQREDPFHCLHTVLFGGWSSLHLDVMHYNRPPRPLYYCACPEAHQQKGAGRVL